MTVKEHLQLHDKQIVAHEKQIKAIRALVQEGMRLVVQTRKEMRQLLAVQKRTSEDVRTLVNSLRRGTNGHSKKKIDLQ